MNAQHEAMWAYVQDSFLALGCRKDPNRPFRDKLSHTRRVTGLVLRLAEAEGGDADLLTTCAIFHDLGYTVDTAEHPLHSARLCRAWLEAHGYPAEYIEKAEAVIRNHGDKRLLRTDTEINTLLLIEADNLDEKGALDVLWDAMEEGGRADPSYEATADRIIRCTRRREHNIMVTPTARRLWRERLSLLRHMSRALKEELSEDILP